MKIRVDFYEVEAPDGVDFRDVLDRVNQIPADGEARNLEILGRPARLIQLTEHGDFFDGDMIRIRMEDLPKKASLVGDIGDLDLEDDEGIGEETAFVYMKQFRVLILQRNRSGVSASAFVRYFEEKAGIDRPINLMPILSPDALARMMNMQAARKLRIGLAGINNLDAIPNGDRYGVNKILELKEIYAAPFIDITLSVGRGDGNLRSRAAKGVARILHLSHDPRVQKLEITGESPDGTREQIDLIDELIKAEHEVPVGANRSISYEARRSALHSCWREKRGEIVSILRRPGDRAHA